MVPESAVGRIICVFTLFSGLLVIALPVIIIGGQFEVEHRKLLHRRNQWNHELLNQRPEKRVPLRTVARLLHSINQKQRKDIFEWQDVARLYSAGFESIELIQRVLQLDHGHVYLPHTLSSYKKYALFELYGNTLRKRNINYKHHGTGGSD